VHVLLKLWVLTHFFSGDDMKIIGIIAEYDPFHNGHAHMLRQVRSRCPEATLVVAMSGSFTQRGGAASFSKYDRAELALRGGADLVALLPVTFASASAERFAQGGVAILRALGVDTLAFGSESADLAPLQRVAQGLESPTYPELLRQALSRGSSFATARQTAVEALVGSEAALLRSPNDLLGVEYLRALRGSGIEALPILRTGAGHNSADVSGSISSASAIRSLLRQGEAAAGLTKVPPATKALLERRMAAGLGPADLSRCDRAMLATLRGCTAADFAALPDVSEGLEHRLLRAAQEATSGEDFCQRAKTKRYAYARLRRILLWSWLGVRRENLNPEPEFLQILAMNQRGQALLHERKKELPMPLLVRPAAGWKLTGAAGAAFALEQRADDLWGLCLPRPLRGGWSCLEQLRREDTPS
jgi:predicted nucleotidyltransferase